jgi:hypothetical protein
MSNDDDTGLTMTHGHPITASAGLVAHLLGLGAGAATIVGLIKPVANLLRILIA